MKICVFGAGAIGGYMGVKLAQAGADVSLVARGPHLAAMQQNGLRLIEEDGEATVSGDRLRGSGRTRGAGLRHRHAQGTFGAGRGRTGCSR